MFWLPLPYGSVRLPKDSILSLFYSNHVSFLIDSPQLTKFDLLFRSWPICAAILHLLDDLSKSSAIFTFSTASKALRQFRGCSWRFATT